jgi:alkylation response protein AidB-like acyl-CoA dehydrogenase
VDFELSDEQRQFQRAAREFAAREWAPHAGEWDARCVFPRQAIARAGELGLCGICVPADAGGLGLTRLDAALVFEELAAADPSTAAYLSIHNMVAWMVGHWGGRELRAQWGPALSSGARLGSYCLTEPGAGSDAASLRTRAERRPDGYVLNGAKAFISGAGETDLLVVMARTGGAGAGGISAFAVPADTPGISYGRNEKKLGWNSQPTRAVSFDNVRVAPGGLLGGEGEGFAIAMRGLDGGRVNIAACSVGAARAAFEAARRHADARQQFGRPLSALQALQFKLADMLTELTAARQMVRLAALKLEAGAPDATLYCAMAKRVATDAGFRVCNEALQLHGGYGVTGDYPVERLLRDARVHQIVEGTNEIMRVIIARHVLGGRTPEDDG